MHYSWLLISLAVCACNKKNDVGSQAPFPAAPPLSGVRPQPLAASSSLKGKVQEVVGASSYSYLRLQTAEGELWAAVPQSDVAVGAEVEIANPQRMDGFESKSLKRRFEKIVFGTLAAAGAAGTPAPEGQGAGSGKPANPSGFVRDKPAPAPESAEPIKVPKAEGKEGKTIAEIFAQTATLKNAPVAVRGKVVKTANGIMGKNWFHVRDGSGEAATSTNDLTVTSQDTAAVGDVVVVKGKVQLDRNFGSGYAYPVIIEDATLQK